MIKKPYKKYVNKVCLYKKVTERDYNYIHVIDIKDNIIKYELNDGKTYYSDISKFDVYEFIVSPMDNKKPNKTLDYDNPF